MSDTGVLRQDYVQGGKATVGFTPDPNSAAQIEALSSQLTEDLRRYRADIAGLVKPWSERWTRAQDLGSKIVLLQEARDRGIKHGAHAWGDDTVSFLRQVGGYMSGIGHYVVEQGEDLANWYGDLSMLEKAFPGYAVADALSHEAADRPSPDFSSVSIQSPRVQMAASAAIRAA